MLKFLFRAFVVTSLTLSLLGTSFEYAFATATVTAVTGGSAISADTTGGSYASLTGPIISEGAVADIGTGTIILNAPSGFIFDTGGTAPTVLVTRIAGSGANTRNINDVASGTSLAITSRTTTQITLTISGSTSNGVRNSLTWQNIRVRPSAGTPLAFGNITKSGTSSIVGVTGSTNFGTLTEVVGAKTQLVYATQPSTSATVATDFTIKPVIAVRDQFGNTVTSDNATTITRTAVLSTQVCGGTAGSGALTSTPASGAAVTAGVMTYTAMQYSFGESIKICVSSSGITSALSNTVTVNNPVPTTTGILPTSKTAGDAGFTLTVNGTNFVSNSVVRFNGSNRTTTFVNSTQLTASILTSDLTTAGNFSITVFNPILGGGTSNTQTFTVNAAADTTAPAAVTNLATGAVTSSSIVVTWTAPGDDGSTGAATTYDLRYSTSAITEGNFSSANQVSGEPTPSIAGSAESMTISGLSPSTTYFFAMKTSDEVPNTSALSNVSSGTTTAAGDTAAPAAITNLALSGATASSIDLSWTAPGDDNNTGTATTYDIRYSTSLITDGNFSSATQVVGEPVPQVAGASQSMTVSGLSANTTYFFAVKTSDEVPNISGLSNVPSLSTLAPGGDTTVPATITDLALSNPTSSSIGLTWTAPGDDGNTGTAASYDIRYSTSAINDGNFSSATQVAGEPAPQIAGTVQTMTVAGLSSDTAYFFAIKTADEAGNISNISNIVSITTLTGPPPPILPAPSIAPVVGIGPAYPPYIFSGRGYPEAEVRVFMGETLILIKTHKIDSSDGFFSFTFESTVYPGPFTIFIVDKNGRNSPSKIRVIPEAKLDFPPTIEVQGNIIRGESWPNGKVLIYADNRMIQEISADANGEYSYQADPGKLGIGFHQMRLKAKDGFSESDFSLSKVLAIGGLFGAKADFNDDKRIDIRDWSVFLNAWSSPDQILIKKADLNQDGRVNVYDFSIFLRLFNP